MNLVIVESPNKVKKIQGYLGAGFQVAATAGHFRDLPERELGVDVASMSPQYVVDDGKKGLVSRLRAQARTASRVYLATDADREGEAIAWHLAQELGLRDPLRMVFTEITQKALLEAVKGARRLDQHLVDAQQARRVLDRLVGFQVSPLLAAFGSNHSAGRVQSATLHLVVKREQERQAFKPEHYKVLIAEYAEGFTARYATLDKAGNAVEARIPADARTIPELIKAATSHIIRKLVTEPAERKPKPPFITSTLQQAASVQLGFKPDRTMELAQGLFERGLITYHRTDSVALSTDAVQMARTFIAKDYPDALPSQPPVYKTHAGSQGAHEAIRPTSLEPVTEELEKDAAELLELIRRRFVACQCRPARIDQTKVTIGAGPTFWVARGKRVTFPSFLRYMAEDEDSEGKEKDPQPTLPSSLFVGLTLQLKKMRTDQLETKPAPRFTQASLISEMERRGIGRPSTYAASVAVLFEREYLAEEKKQLVPTSRGLLVDEMLGKAFVDLLDADYTAQMESRLDEVAQGKLAWKPELFRWYGGFTKQLAAAPGVFAQQVKSRPELIENTDAPKPTGKPCPRCSQELMLRAGKKGAFLACSGYPLCTYSADPTVVQSQRTCPTCQKSRMEEVQGKFGGYARCLDPSCKGRVDLAELAQDIDCPQCGSGMKDRGSFLSCVKYPACKGSLDKKALKAGKKCPQCNRLLSERKGLHGPFWGCSGYPICKFIEKAPQAGPKPAGAARRAGEIPAGAKAPAPRTPKKS